MARWVWWACACACENINRRFGTDLEDLLQTFANQFAVAVVRAQLDEASQRIKMLSESKRLYKTLLNSISHELRTPIATIDHAASQLINTQPIESGQHSTLSWQSHSAPVSHRGKRSGAYRYGSRTGVV